MLIDFQLTDVAWLIFRSLAVLTIVWGFGYLAGRYHAKAIFERRTLAAERQPGDPD